MPQDCPYASRGGLKLQAALDAFAIDPTGLTCADFGANVGGFTDCLVQRGAAKVYAVDTGYGDLAWTLRKDDRVVVMERTNVLYAEAPDAPVQLITADMSWTPQTRTIPVALKWLDKGGRIISLVKPHYERAKLDGKRPHRPLTDEESAETLQAVIAQLTDLGATVVDHIESPIRGKGGNAEYLLLITP